MLSQHGRRQADAAFFPDKRHGMTHAVETTGCGVVVLHDDLVRPGVRVLEELSERIDRRTGNADLGEGSVPLSDRPGRNRRLNMIERLGAMGDTICIGAEFGIIDDQLVLIDECLTPDSSRFWPVAGYQEGTSPPSFDKQFVRDYLESVDWNKRPPAPHLPAEVVEKTAQKYQDALVRLTGYRLASR